MDSLAQSKDFEMGGKQDDEKVAAPYSTNDYYADYIMNLYLAFQTNKFFVVKVAIVASAPTAILLFAMFVSSAASTLVAFVTLVISCSFIVLSLNMLGWISDHEIAEPIKEGSEGFFKTQYGTIFKLAFGLFLIYSMREPM